MPLISLWSRQIKTRTYWKLIIIIIIIIIIILIIIIFIIIVIIIIITIILSSFVLFCFFSEPQKCLSIGQVKWTEFFCPALSI